MVSIAVQDSEVEDRPTTLINPLLSCQMDMACGIEVGTSEWMGAMFNRTHLMGQSQSFRLRRLLEWQWMWLAELLEGYNGVTRVKGEVRNSQLHPFKNF